MTSIEERFWSKVNQGTGCWEWIAAKTGSGYGEFWIRGKMEGAHRVAYELKQGPIPSGLQICHTCDNPVCVNPKHLFLGTHTDNMKDAANKGRLTGNRRGVQGSRHGASKLTEDEIVTIRKDGRLHRIIAEDHDVTRRTISDIKKCKTWKHVNM